MSECIGVLGSGSFGTAIARLLSKNNDVLLYTRRDDIMHAINEKHSMKGYPLSETITATKSLEEVAEKCHLIFPIIPSQFLRQVAKQISPYVGPGHILIHGTKGLDVSTAYDSATTLKEIRKSVFTMCEVIKQETSVIRTGALAGPNLAKEMRLSLIHI